MTPQNSEFVGKIIVYGAGGLGREVLQLARTVVRDESRIAGYVDDGTESGEVRNDALVLGGGDYLDTLDKPFSLLLGISAPHIKRAIYERFSRNPLAHFPSVVHPNAVVSEYAVIGEGSVVTSSCIISIDARLGKCVFLNNGAIIGHDSTVGDFSSVMPLSAISGNVAVGEDCLIGAQSVIRQELSIGRGCTVGMGSVVLRSIPDGAIVIGNPARRMS